MVCAYRSFIICPVCSHGYHSGYFKEHVERHKDVLTFDVMKLITALTRLRRRGQECGEEQMRLFWCPYCNEFEKYIHSHRFKAHPNESFRVMDNKKTLMEFEENLSATFYFQLQNRYPNLPPYVDWQVTKLNPIGPIFIKLVTYIKNAVLIEKDQNKRKTNSFNSWFIRHVQRTTHLVGEHQDNLKAIFDGEMFIRYQIESQNLMANSKIMYITHFLTMVRALKFLRAKRDGSAWEVLISSIPEEFVLQAEVAVKTYRKSAQNEAEKQKCEKLCRDDNEAIPSPDDFRKVLANMNNFNNESEFVK